MDIEERYDGFYFWDNLACEFRGPYSTYEEAESEMRNQQAFDDAVAANILMEIF